MVTTTTTLNETPNSVTALGPDDLINTPLSNIADIIATLPQGSAGTGLRTPATGSDIRFLINGEPTDTSFLGTLPLSQINSVSILQDGNSSIYGSDAVGGVINIITNDSYTPYINSLLSGGLKTPASGAEGFSQDSSYSSQFGLGGFGSYGSTPYDYGDDGDDYDFENYSSGVYTDYTTGYPWGGSDAYGSGLKTPAKGLDFSLPDSVDLNTGYHPLTGSIIGQIDTSTPSVNAPSTPQLELGGFWGGSMGFPEVDGGIKTPASGHTGTSYNGGTLPEGWVDYGDFLYDPATDIAVPKSFGASDSWLNGGYPQFPYGPFGSGETGHTGGIKLPATGADIQHQGSDTSYSGATLPEGWVDYGDFLYDPATDIAVPKSFGASDSWLNGGYPQFPYGPFGSGETGHTGGIKLPATGADIQHYEDDFGTAFIVPGTGTVVYPGGYVPTNNNMLDSYFNPYSLYGEHYSEGIKTPAAGGETSSLTPGDGLSDFEAFFGTLFGEG